MASVVHCLLVNSGIKPKFPVRVQGLGCRNAKKPIWDSVAGNGVFLGQKRKNGALICGCTREEDEKNPAAKDVSVSTELEALWDDGYGTCTVKDYMDVAKEMIKPDGGPPRWFSPVECDQPLPDSPTLLFLPGIDGVGLGLTLHHKALGKAFEVWCLHIPVPDRTQFEDLVKHVEEIVKTKHVSSPTKPIYLVGDSLGACLALAVAARNPDIDLVLILVNPGTSFGRSQLQALIPLLEALPEGLDYAVPYLLSFHMGDPLKMATVDIERTLPAGLKIQRLSGNVSALLPHLSVSADIIPKDTLLWKLKLLKSAATYVNSRLHAVKAEVLVLASGKDYILPSRNEAKRLSSSLKNCKVRNFKENGHTLLLEEGIKLLTVIKGAGKYQRSRKLDCVSDFLPVSTSEFKSIIEETASFVRFVAGSAVFSTMEDGRIVRGLAGVPNKGPVLLVGYHMLMGVEIYSIIEEFLREKQVHVRGIAYPALFNGQLEDPSCEHFYPDWFRVMGAVPVSASNIFKLLASAAHVLLYPGGAREALHNKGEAYKLIWPNQQEFVRMAARFGATIIPFGTVGEDDIFKMVLDYHDLMKIPILNRFIREAARAAPKVRDESLGEVANREIFVPGLLPKLPGRFYFLFGKPIETNGKEELLKDKDSANELYLQVKSQIQCNIDYLLKKRKEDPYRNIIDRTLHRALHSPLSKIPAFDP